MPSRSKAQFRFMAAACRGDTRGDIPKSVACEYHQADRKGKRYKDLPARKEAGVTPEYLEWLAALWGAGT